MKNPPTLLRFFFSSIDNFRQLITNKKSSLQFINHHNHHSSLLNTKTIIPTILIILIIILSSSITSSIILGQNTTLLNSIDKKEQAVRTICEKAREYHSEWDKTDYSSCVYYDACDVNLQRRIPYFDCAYNFGHDSDCGCGGEKMSKHYAVIKYAPASIPGSNDMIREFECMSSELRRVFRSNLVNDDQIRYQYLASNEGALQLFPGIRWRYQTSISQCKKSVSQDAACPYFDPRIRPWYVSSAAGSKSVVIILDVSSSMGANNRLEIAIAAAISVIEGLSNRDRLSLVFFSDSAYTCTFSGGELLPVSSSNLKLFKKCLLNTTPFGATNFESAFNLAFDLFEKDKKKATTGSSTTTTCNNVIIFLTDGERTSGSAPEDIIKEKNQIYQAKLFTFSFGDEASVETPKKIACENGGLWGKIKDGDFRDLRTQMSSYYEYLSYRETNNDQVIWSEIYEDTTGLGSMTTASIACFTNDGRLIGVAGVDVPVKYFNDDSDYLNKLIERGATCPPKTIPDSFINALRGDQFCNYCSCPRRTIITVSFFGVLVVIIFATILCISLCIFYCTFSKRKRWIDYKNRLQKQLETHRGSFGTLQNPFINQLNNIEGDQGEELLYYNRVDD